jgi:hypothetical protein
MSSDDRDDDSKQHSKDEWYNHRPTKLTIAIAGLIVYGFFVIFDVREIWPWSPLAAIFIGIPVTIAALYLEAFATEAIGFPTFMISSAVVVAAGIVIYFFAPRHHGPEVEIIGTLQPGGEPTPPNGCAPTNEPDAWKILIGTAAIQFIGPNNTPLLMIGEQPVLTISRDDKGVSIAADLFDAEGRHLAAIQNNEFHAINGADTWIDRENDLSKLIVMAGDPREILFVHYLNKSTVRVRGVFSYPGHMTVAIRDNGVVATKGKETSNLNLAPGACSTFLRGVTGKAIIGTP